MIKHCQKFHFRIFGHGFLISKHVRAGRHGILAPALEAETSIYQFLLFDFVGELVCRRVRLSASWFVGELSSYRCGRIWTELSRLIWFWPEDQWDFKHHGPGGGGGAASVSKFWMPVYVHSGWHTAIKFRTVTRLVERKFFRNRLPSPWSPAELLSQVPHRQKANRTKWHRANGHNADKKVS